MPPVTRERLARFAATRYHRSTRAAIKTSPPYAPADQVAATDDLYPDAVRIAADAGQPVSRFVADFGEYLLPDLIHECPCSVDPDWQAIDLVAHIDCMLRTALPRDTIEVSIVRTGERDFRVRFVASAFACYFVRGIIHGISRLYHQPLVIEDPAGARCGDAVCETVVRVG